MKSWNNSYMNLVYWIENRDNFIELKAFELNKVLINYD